MTESNHRNPLRATGRLSRRFLAGLLLWASLGLTAEFELLAQPRIVPELAGERVDRIRVLGNRRASSDEILYNIKLGTGQNIDLDVISDDIKRIYAMGFFDDIQVDVDELDGERVITYYVIEKPAIAGITFAGNQKFSESDLLEKIDLRVPSILDESKVKSNEEKIREHYLKEGFYLAEVSSTVTAIEDGDVEVLFTIREYSKVTVRQITILGNQAMPDEKIKEHIFTREASLLGFLSGAGDFKEDEFKKDMQRIAAFYADNGYPDARVSDPQVSLSEDRRSMFITLRIEEGEAYTISDVDISGDLLFSKEELLASLQLSAGQGFKLSTLFADIKTLRDRYADEGYAYVNVEPKRRRDAEANTIGLTYDIVKGKQVRFGRIEIIGNQKTADKVIRRELLIAEGEIYSGTDIERSQRSVQRLGFFEKVDIRTNAARDQRFLDVQVEVTERPTGTFQVGAGFSSIESFIATIQVSQENFLGFGTSLTAQASFSGLRQLFNIQYFDPYFLESDWRVRVTGFKFDFLFSDFTRSSYGGNIGFGYPLLRELILDLTYSLEQVDVTPGGSLGRQKRNIGTIFQGGLTSSLGVTLAWDTRDNRLFPSSGFIQQLGVEFADDLLLGENEFTRLTGRSRWYFPLFFGLVLKFNVEAGLISDWNAAGEPVPIFERFFVGGPNSVRGFRRASLGPTRKVASDVDDPSSVLTKFNVGGDKQFLFNAEIEIPILTSVGIKGVVFADAGNAFDNDQDIAFALDVLSEQRDYSNVLRTAVGFGFRWLSPIGPLRFEWGFPLAPLSDEEPFVFEFSIGNSF